MPLAVAGRYVLHERLGKGGAGSVYRATDRLTGTVVAMKQVTLPAGPRGAGSTSDLSQADIIRLALANEFQMLASLHHPHIIGVLDYGFDRVQAPADSSPDDTAEAQPYFTMEYVEGSRPLTEARDEAVETRVDLLIQVLQALTYLHRRGIVHRDLKPGNVLIVPAGRQPGAPPVAKVLDFGLSISRGQAGGVGGTIAYMAPELLREGRPADELSDLYAVGVMAYELLAGRHPYDLSNSVSLIHGIFNGAPSLAAVEGGEALAGVVGRLMAKEPAARFPSAEACIDALSSAVGRPPPRESPAIRESFIEAARFVGREAELGCLVPALNEMVAGRGSAWLVAGESGVGKTRLLDELRIRALVAGARVVRTQAVRGVSSAYQLWREPLRLLALTTELSDLEAAILKPVIPDIEALLERPVPRVPELGPGGRQRLLSTIIGVLARQTVPLLLILEDLHSSGEGLDVVRQMQRRLSHLPVLIVGSYRDDEAADLPAHLPTMRMLKLERLSAGDMAELSESILGQAGRRPDVLALLQRETEGNAFFLVEVVRALAGQSGQLGSIGDMPLPKQVFPSGIQTIVQRRLDRVPAEARALLRAAAVAGRQVDIKVVAVLAEATGPSITTWLATCANAAVLEMRDGQWRFAHDKLRDGLLTTLDDRERVALHRQVALVVESVYPGDAEHAAALAWHWRMAGDAERERACARLAGEQAADRFANAEALEHLSRALELTDERDVGERYAILRRREQVHGLLGEREAQYGDLCALDGLLEAWGDTRMQAELASRYAEYLVYVTDFRRAIDKAQKAIGLAQAAGDVAIEALACLTWGQALWRLAEFRESRARLERALELSREAGSRLAEATGLRILGNVDYYTGDYGTAAAFWQQSLAISREIADRAGEASALSNLGEAARSQGDYVHAQGYYEQRLRICRDIGERYGEAIALLNLSLVAHSMGDHQAAHDRALAGLRIAVEIGNRSQQGYALVNLGHGLADLGRLAEADTAYRQSLAVRRDIGELHLAMESLAGVARVALARGDLPAAREAAGEIVAYLRSGTLDGTDEPMRVYATCYHVLDAAGDPRAGEILAAAYMVLQAQAEHIGDPALRRSFLENVAYHRDIVRAAAENTGTLGGGSASMEVLCF